MNKIFKVIWSRTKNCYVTASELAKGHTKSASTGSKARRKLLTSAAALAMVLTFAGGGNAWASVTVNTTDPGTPATVYTTEEVDNALGEKANSTDVASTYATKTEVADTYATKTALTEGLAEKANSDDVANTYA
ncbi:ESPR domain-containing protein, partial [Dialister hominis]|uniref:ESPR domain-containing protein n=2 Tax=Dialister TaxID=39948 RepID=UPI00402570D8